MHALELKIPPTIVCLVTGWTMWLLARLRPELRIGLVGLPYIAGVLALIGLAIVVLAVVALRRARTTLNPTAPSRSGMLVTHGVYRWSRNPMYLGLLFWLSAWALILGSPFALFGIPVFFAYMTRFQIIPEERALAAKFGEEFARYSACVRRWM